MTMVTIAFWPGSAQKPMHSYPRSLQTKSICPQFRADRVFRDWHNPLFKNLFASAPAR
jgi:hypothetical protein